MALRNMYLKISKIEVDYELRPETQKTTKFTRSVLFFAMKKTNL